MNWLQWEDQLDAIVELKQRMLLLEKAHAAAGMGHFVLDPKRMTIEFSAWVRENVGLNDMPIPVDRLPEIIAPQDREEFTQHVAELIEGQQDFAFETNIITAKGKIRTQKISGIAAFEKPRSREGLIGFFGILQEITRQSAAERALQEAHDLAHSQLAARNNLLAIVSHEIRTPLGGVLGIIDQLKRERVEEERDRGLQLIEESCEVLLGTLDAIVQQARYDQEGEHLISEQFRPASLAQRVAELFRPLARRKGIRIEVDAASTKEVLGDPGRIQQALSNLVSNAVKFTQAGAVSLYVQEPLGSSDEWIFAVSDTGSGMDPKRLAGIFNPFGESSTDSLGRAVGSGLGLSITRDLVDTIGGRIEVESELGEGTSFTLAIHLEACSDGSKASAQFGVRGQAIVCMERASDMVQVEAVVSEFGFETATRNATEVVDADEKAILLIIDDGSFESLPDEVSDRFQNVFVLTTNGEPAPLHGPSSAWPDIAFLSGTSIAKSLSDLLQAKFDDPD